MGRDAMFASTDLGLEASPCLPIKMFSFIIR